MKQYYLFIVFALLITTSKADPAWEPSVLIQADHYGYVFCHDGLGRAEAFVTGGIPPFEYTWFDYYGNVVGRGLVLDSAPPSPDGFGYYFEVRKDTIPEGSGAWFSTDLLNPDSLVIEFNTHPYPSGHHISAPDSSDGQITATVYGGISGYTYEWSNGSHASEISNLYSGTYTLTITDFLGCQKTKSVTLTEPPSPLHVVSISSPIINLSGFNISEYGKADGRINLSVNGGAPPYKIRWSPLGETNNKNPDTLWARQYTAEITDNNGAVVHTSITLREPTKLQLTLTPIVYPTCSDCNNGSITAVPSGGVPPYTYLWKSGQTTPTISGLTSGEYVVIVTDKNGAQVKDGTYLKAPESHDWSINGNGNITSTNFIGTTNSQDLIFRTSNSERLRIQALGDVLVNKNLTAQQLNLIDRITFSGTHVIGFQLATSTARAILSFGHLPTAITSCVSPSLNTLPNYQFNGTIQLWQNNVSGGGLNVLEIGHDGANAIIDATGTTNDPTYNRLLINYYCGKDVFIGNSNSGDLIANHNFYTYGKVGIGTLNINSCTDCSDYNLFVTKGIRTEKVRVDIAAANNWADYVFSPDYKLKTLVEVEDFIKQNKHLSGVPTSDEVISKGVDLAEMQKILLEKIEELTLYVIQLKKEKDTLRVDINALAK